MKKHKKSIIGVVLMVLITLGVYILFKGCLLYTSPSPRD